MEYSRLTWLWAAFLIVSASFMRQLLNIFMLAFNREQLAWFLWAGFALGALAVFWMVRKLGDGKRVVALAIIFAVGCAYALSLEVPEERIHLLKYGLLGWLAARDLTTGRTAWQAIWVLPFALFVACVDEGFQHWLPYRVGDVRDLLINSLGGIWGASLWLAGRKTDK